MSLAMDRCSRLNRVVLTAMLLMAWMGGAVPLARAADDLPATAPARALEANDRQLQQMGRIAEQIDLALPLLQETHRQIPRDRFDPEAVVELVGRDPEKLFAWVRDQTTWVAYAGTLRGAGGVLQDRLGNSLDRSLLLAELLRAAGQKVRLARAELSVEIANALLSKVRGLPKDPITDPELDRKKVGEALKTLAEKHHVNGDIFQAVMDRNLIESSRQREETAQNCAEQSRRLIELLGVGPAADQAIEQARVVGAIRSHFWIQYSRDGRWLDLDPLLPDAVPGKAVAVATSTIDWGQRDRTIPLDPKLYHEVELRLIAEQWKDGKLVEKAVLTHVLRPSQLGGVTLQLRHLPQHKPRIFEQASLDEFRKEVMTETEWLPVLTVGESSVVQGSVDIHGNVNEKPALNAVAAFGAKSVGKGFGGLNDGLGGVSPAAPAGILTAESIDYVIRAPNEPPRTIRRQLFDVIGPAARISARSAPLAEPKLTADEGFNRGLALLGQTEILVTGFVPSSEYVEHLSGATIIANCKPLAAICRQAADPTRERLDDRVVRDVTGFAADLYGFAILRHAWSGHRDDTYLDRCNIVSRHTALRQNADGQVVNCAGLDIVANGVAVRSGASPSPFQVRLRQGIVDTNVELALMANCGKVLNTADAFEWRATGEWTVVRSVTDAAWTSLNVPPDIRARADAELRDGYIVVIAATPVIVDGAANLAYWRVDSVTGECIGIGPNGWGAAMTDYQIAQMRVAARSISTGACAMFAAIKGSVVGAALCLLGGGLGVGGDVGRVVNHSATLSGTLSTAGIVASAIGMFVMNLR